jgi:glycosidase
MTYQISGAARAAYDVPEPYVDDVGAVRYTSTEEVRRLEYQIRRGEPGRRATAGELIALGVLNKVIRHLVGLHRGGASRDPLLGAVEGLRARLGADALRGCLVSYLGIFPPRLSRPELPDERAADLMVELLLLSMCNRNPACAEFRPLFSDERMLRETAYGSVIAGIETWSAAAGPVLGRGVSLVDLLFEPIRHAPGSLLDQLEYVRVRWGDLLGGLLDLLHLALGILREETKLRWGGAPGGPVPIPSYGDLEHEGERYSTDVAWMPSLVLMAKHVMVWLHQLRVRYARQIYRLDQIPNEELDHLAESGITGLWLIGLWRRSPASRTIKHRCGNPEAVGSAYSVVEYTIAPELGGDESVRALGARCGERGIRLACDMVPNHTSLDSRWVAEHPDWFVQTEAPPFPGYRFASDDVSEDPRMAVRIEDHYYDRSDAAVVFQRVDRGSGHARYLYHGNDGTSTPWNDTAQLDFLRADVREAVIQQILEVARRFPVIRFDAAMVLTRKHIRRLWHPPPGGGGDIPSRAERGCTQEVFDRSMPKEFWREVVDRVAAEVPGTLLLAEAFWLLEGYFVRSLGMHRVYNSAFMNMLKTEDNGGYRQLMKSTLEFDPEILKRYVNFMSNPDEEPAAVQFGTGDKYFGVAVMMATLPGLPMFGHGQVEGASEKYGMEYGRSYRDERPDPDFVERHRREIFPLLRQRPLFAEVHSFRLYDLYTADGSVNEDVFVYSNRRDAAFALVVYNNRYREAVGWITLSSAYRDRVHGSGLLRRHLGEEMWLSRDPACYCLFRDAVSGLEYLRPSARLLAEGLRVSLGAFRYHVFLDVREVRDNRLGHYARLEAELGGSGTPSLGERLDAYVRPVHQAVRSLFEAVAGSAAGAPEGGRGRGNAAADARRALGNGILEAYAAPVPSEPQPQTEPSAATGPIPSPAQPWLRCILELRRACRSVEPDLQRIMHGATPAAYVEELRLPEAARRALGDLGAPAETAHHLAALLWVLANERDLLCGPDGPRPPDLAAILSSSALRSFLGVNWFEGKEFVRQEPFEYLMDALAAEAAPDGPVHGAARAAVAAARVCGYRVDLLLSARPAEPGVNP